MRRQDGGGKGGGKGGGGKQRESAMINVEHDAWGNVLYWTVQHVEISCLQAVRVVCTAFKNTADHLLLQDEVRPLMQGLLFRMPEPKHQYWYPVSADTLLIQNTRSHLHGLACLQHDILLSLRTVEPFVLLRVAATARNRFTPNILIQIVVFLRFALQRSLLNDAKITGNTITLQNIYNVLSLVVFERMDFPNVDTDVYRWLLPNLFTPWMLHVRQKTTNLVSRKFGANAAELMRRVLPLVSGDVTGSVCLHFCTQKWFPAVYFAPHRYWDFLYRNGHNISAPIGPPEAWRKELRSGHVITHIDLICGDDQDENLLLKRACYSTFGAKK
jgi:hypothetical protein